MIKNALQWTAKHRPLYLKAIEKRETGSHWGRVLPWQEMIALPWEKLPTSRYIQGIHLTDCQYYFLSKIDRLLPLARKNFRLLSSFDREELRSVQIQEGSHGIELVSPLVREDQPTIAWLILGQARYENKEIANDQVMVWSAFPGDLTASIKHVPEFDGTLESLINCNLPIAVKGL